MANTVELRIYPDAGKPPALVQASIPWFAGMTALEAMITGEAMNPKNFAFRVEYRSIYGAQIDSIDGLADGDTANHFWLLWIDGVEATVGASEAIIQEDTVKVGALIEWKYTDVSAGAPASLVLKTKPL